jgi:hypothetical protein
MASHRRASDSFPHDLLIESVARQRLGKCFSAAAGKHATVKDTNVHGVSYIIWVENI